MTIFSATACRLEMLRTFRSCVSQMQTSVQRKAQHVKHARRLIGQGIDLAGIFGDGQKTEALKKRERPSDIEAFQRKARKLRLLPVVVREPDVAVGEIASAVAGGKKLFADAALPLEKRD